MAMKIQNDTEYKDAKSRWNELSGCLDGDECVKEFDDLSESIGAFERNLDYSMAFDEGYLAFLEGKEEVNPYHPIEKLHDGGGKHSGWKDGYHNGRSIKN